MGIGETLCRTLAKLVIGAAGEHANTACGNIQLCAGLKANIEGDTNAGPEEFGKGEKDNT